LQSEVPLYLYNFSRSAKKRKKEGAAILPAFSNAGFFAAVSMKIVRWIDNPAELRQAAELLEAEQAIVKAGGRFAVVSVAGDEWQVTRRLGDVEELHKEANWKPETY
jgi:hypothetical protein